MELPFGVFFYMRKQFNFRNHSMKFIFKFLTLYKVQSHWFSSACRQACHSVYSTISCSKALERKLQKNGGNEEWMIGLKLVMLKKAKRVTIFGHESCNEAVATPGFLFPHDVAWHCNCFCASFWWFRSWAEHPSGTDTIDVRTAMSRNITKQSVYKSALKNIFDGRLFNPAVQVLKIHYWNPNRAMDKIDHRNGRNEKTSKCLSHFIIWDGNHILYFGLSTFKLNMGKGMARHPMAVF